MKKNRYLKISGGVDNKNKKRALLTALLLGALFCWQVQSNNAEAYTYSGQNITTDKLIEDENDLTITQNSHLIANQNMNIQKWKTMTLNEPKDYNALKGQNYWVESADWRSSNYNSIDAEYDGPYSQKLLMHINDDLTAENIGNSKNYGLEIKSYTFAPKKDENTIGGRKMQNHFVYLTKDFDNKYEALGFIHKYYGYIFNKEPYDTTSETFKNSEFYKYVCPLQFVIEDPTLVNTLLNLNKSFNGNDYHDEKVFYAIQDAIRQKYPNLYEVINYDLKNDSKKNKPYYSTYLYILPTTNLFIGKQNEGDGNITIDKKSSLKNTGNIITTKKITLDDSSSLMNSGDIQVNELYLTNKSTISANNLNFISKTPYMNVQDSTLILNGNLDESNEKLFLDIDNGTIRTQGDITLTDINLTNKINITAKNMTIKSLFLPDEETTGLIDISNGTLRLLDSEGIDENKIKINAKILKTDDYCNLGLDTHITGKLTLKGKAQAVSAGTTNTDMINKAQMTTALGKVKLNLGKTYSAGTGISLSTNNAVGLTNAAAYTTADKKRISLVGAAKTDLKKVKAGKVSATSKDLMNGSQLYDVQQSIAGFAGRIQTNKNQLEVLKSSINAKKTELSGIQKDLNTIKETKLSQDMSNLTTDGEAIIKTQVKKAIQKFQKDMDVSTVQANVQEAKVTTTANALSSENNEPSIMLADAPIEATSKPINTVSAISKKEVAAKADLSQTKVNLEKKATLDTMDVSAYTKQLSKGLTTGESAYHALQEAKEDRLVQAKENTLTVGANGAETKIDASKKNWTGIVVNEKEAGSMANVGYVNQTLSMESSYDRLSLMKKNLEKDTNRGIAKAAALAALKPIGHDEEDKGSFAIGYGHYKDGNAAAIGTFYRPNQDILIHLDVTAGAGKPSMNTGVSFKVGKRSSYASMTREQLAEENAAMKDQAEKQAERIHTQKEKIEHLESVMQSIRF